MINGVWLGFIGVFALLILSLALYRSGSLTRKWKMLGLTGALVAITAGIVLGLYQHSQPKPAMATATALDAIDPQELQQLEATVLKDPKNVAALDRLAHLELKGQNFERVADLSQKVLVLDPNNVETLAHMGMLHFAMGQPDGAIHFFEKALKIDPNNSETLLFKGIVESQKNPQ